MGIDIDSAIFISFLVVNLVVGLAYSGGIKSMVQYSVGDRNFSTAAITATIVATFIGGGSFSMWTSGVYKTGLYHMLLGVCDVLTFYVVCYVIAPRCGEFLGKLSIAEAMGDLYGLKARTITAIVGMFRTAGAIAMQFKVGAIVLSYAFSGYGDKIMALAALVVIIYSTLGGIRAVVMTDIVQLLTFAVFIPILAFIIWNNLEEPAEVITTISTNPIFDYRIALGIDNYKGLINLLFISIVFLLPHLDPAVFQRIAIAKDIKQVKKSFFWAAFCILLITFLTYWVAILLLTEAPQLDPNKIIPYLLENYTYAGLRGVILAGIIAILISTADSYLNASAILFAHDIIKPLGIVHSSKAELLTSRLASLIVGLLAIILATSIKDMLALILFIANFYVPLVTAPLYLAIAGFRSSFKAVSWGMVAGLSITLLFYLYNVQLDSTIPALLANAIVTFSVHYLFKEPGGWVGIKDQASLNGIRKERQAYTNQIIDYVQNFNLMNFFKSNAPKHEYIYFSFGLFSMVSMFCVMHSIPKAIHAAHSGLSSFIFNTVLFLASVFLSYPAWPERFKSENAIAVAWNLGSFYVMIFAISLLVIMSNFGQLPMMIFMINLIIISALMRWQTALFMLVIGVYGAITFFKWHIGISTLPDSNIAMQFKLIYAVLLMTSTLIMFFKPKQEYIEETEHKAEVLEGQNVKLSSEVTGLNSQVTGLTTHVTDLNGQVTGLNNQVVTLNTKVGDLSEQVTHYIERIADHEKEMDRLGETSQRILNNVNHELRLPIGNVVNFADMLHETLQKTENNKLLKELAKEVYDNSHRVSGMILNMLDLATLEVQKINLEKTTVNLSELVKDRVSQCRKIYQKNKSLEFKLEMEPEVMITIDPNYIRQTVDNLVINAITFSEKGAITIGLKKEEGEVIFTITDEGKGIPRNELYDIFTPFKMGSNSESKACGRGVGLALCKSAVQAHGGSILADSDGICGAKLQFTLPLESAANT